MEGKRPSLSSGGLRYGNTKGNFQEQRGYQSTGDSHENDHAVYLRTDYGHAQPDLRHDHADFSARDHAQSHFKYILPAEREGTEAAANQLGDHGGCQYEQSEEHRRTRTKGCQIQM